MCPNSNCGSVCIAKVIRMSAGKYVNLELDNYGTIVVTSCDKL